MNTAQTILVTTLFAIFAGSVFLAGQYFLPWQYSNWIKSQATITVEGEARGQQKNQRATFTAGVNAVNDSKDKAIEEVNQKTVALIEEVKRFGIADADIKTQNISVYQSEDTYYEEGRQKTRPGQWRVSNSIEIRLRQADRASDLTQLLTQSGATNIYGPSFSFDDPEEVEGLTEQAVRNAREKAERIAKSSGRRLGAIVTISEGPRSASDYPILFKQGAGGGGPVEPGTSTVSKTVTVTFELR